MPGRRQSSLLGAQKATCCPSATSERRVSKHDWRRCANWWWELLKLELEEVVPRSGEIDIVPENLPATPELPFAKASKVSTKRARPAARTTSTSLIHRAQFAMAFPWKAAGLTYVLPFLLTVGTASESRRFLPAGGSCRSAKTLQSYPKSCNWTCL